MKIRVVNKHRKEVGEYIGRGSPLGNPWPIQGLDTREIVIARYKEYLYHQIKIGNKEIINELERLGDIAITTGSLNLQCFCSPKPCHGDVIKDLLDKEIAEYMEEKTNA